jgi:hypothetical protein
MKPYFGIVRICVCGSTWVRNGENKLLKEEYISTSRQVDLESTFFPIIFTI